MDEQAVGALLGVGDREAQARAGHLAAIADLAAAFGVERRLVEHDEAAFAGLEARHFLAVLDQREHHALGGLGVVAEELGRAELVAQREPHRLRGGVARARPVLAGLGALALHGGLERCGVDADIAAAQRILRQVEREAVGVVQLEGDLAGQRIALAELGALLVEDLQAAHEGLAEAGLLELQRLGDQRLGLDEFRIGRAHFADERRHELEHHRLAGAEQFGVAHGAAHDAAEHVAAALVRRQHAVGDEEGGRAQMVGDDPVARAARAFGIDADGLDRSADQALEQVGVVVRMHALHDRRHALEAHAGVDRRTRQVDPLAGRQLLVLHEDEVPEFEEPVAVFVRAAGRAALQGLALVDEDFRARAARAGVAHLPEIVRCRDADDAAFGQARDLLPEIEGLVVGVVDGDEELVLRQAEHARSSGARPGRSRVP